MVTDCNWEPAGYVLAQQFEMLTTEAVLMCSLSVIVYYLTVFL